MIRILLTLVILSGCTELNAIEPDYCGNGVVENGEDCDSNLAHCSGCSLVCETTEDCGEFGGPSFVCGADHLCHAPAGSFIHTAQVALEVDSYRIADASGDGIGDVIAQSGTSVSVLYGAAAGPLSTISTVQSPIAQGPVTFAKLDGDNVPDLLVPTIDGIAAFTFKYGVPAPYTFPKRMSGISIGEPLMTFDIGGNYLGGVIVEGTRLKLVVIEVGFGGEKVVSDVTLCDGVAGEFSQPRSDVSVLPVSGVPVPGSKPPLHVVFTTILSSNGVGRVCAIALDEITTAVPPSPFTLSEIPTTAPRLAADPRGVLVVLGGSSCPTLIVQDLDGALLELPAKPNAFTPEIPCGFGETMTLQRRDVAGIPKQGGAPVGSLELDGPDVGIVLTDGIYVYQPAGVNGPRLRQFYISARPLAAVAVVDLDGDPEFDLVAMGDESEDLDLLYQIRFPVPNTYGFLRVRLDTDAVVTRVLPGDYDGNLRSDIAYAERVDGVDRLMIAYGTSDRPLPGQAVGSFDRLSSLNRIDLGDATDPFGVVDDLAVLYGTGADKRIALLHGSPQRTMQAFFDPREALADGPSRGLGGDLGGVIPGHFGGGGGHDILGLATTNNNLASTLYVTPAAPGGELSGTASCGDVATLQRCAVVSSNQGTAAGLDLCTNLASYISWAVSATHDVVIGIDGYGNAATFDPVQTGDCMTIPDMTANNWSTKLALARRDEARKVRSVEPVGPDSSELAISFAPGHAGLPTDAAIRVCTIENGAAASCEDPASMISGQLGVPVVCSDLASGRATEVSRFGGAPSPLRDLIAACQTPGGRFVYRLSRFDGLTQITELFALGAGDEIEVGDVNGDAIDDIVVLERGATESTLHVYTQCTSRNASDCEQAEIQLPPPGLPQ